MALDPDLFRPLVLLFMALAFVAGLALATFIIRRLRIRLGSVNRKKGQAAEQQARDLLEEEGFEVLEVQPRFSNELLLDGTPTRFEITPDLMVIKDGQRYVVEIKRYREGCSVQNAGIRRQVVEYLLASGLPCLLVKMPEGEIDLIELPERLQ